MNPFGPYTMANLPPFDDSWKQHCLSCAHCRPTTPTTEGGGYRILSCARAGYRKPCIEERDPNGSCGPEANGWQA